MDTISRPLWDEVMVDRLRRQYERYGYDRYRMSKFEEYDLYARNMDFLEGDGVITFTDTDGRLMALKPDITLSIVKNMPQCQGYVQKVYYHEMVYRIGRGTGSFCEIPQMGLECLGDLDDYAMGEVVMLAVKSLRAIGGQTLLALSHMGVITGLLQDITAGPEEKEQILSLLAAKNTHELASLGKNLGMTPQQTETLMALAERYGPLTTVFAY